MAKPEPIPQLTLDQDNNSPMSMSFNFQSVRKEILGVPEEGVEPVPHDVQAIADKVRDAVANRININVDTKSKSDSKRKISTKASKETTPKADKRVYIMSDISMKPLVKMEPAKSETQKMMETPKSNPKK